MNDLLLHRVGDLVIMDIDGRKMIKKVTAVTADSIVVDGRTIKILEQQKVLEPA